MNPRWIIVLVLSILTLALVQCSAPAPAASAPPPAEQPAQAPAVQPTAPPAAPQPATPSAAEPTAPPAVEQPTQPPAAVDGRAVLEGACADCHNLNRTESKKKSEADWTTTVDRMIAKGAKLTAEERLALIQYLAANYKP